MKDVKGYEGLYAVTSCGKVWSYRNECFLKPRANRCGYLYLNLSKNGKAKSYMIHRLVAEAYLPNPENLPQVNHKDENKANNCLQNLEWCDASYNVKHAYDTGLLKSSVAILLYPCSFRTLKAYDSI